MSETQNTHKLAPVPGRHVLRSVPADPYVATVVSLLMFVVAFLGGLPEGVDTEEVRVAVESIGAGGAVLGSLAVAMWRRRIQTGK